MRLASHAAPHYSALGARYFAGCGPVFSRPRLTTRSSTPMSDRATSSRIFARDSSLQALCATASDAHPTAERERSRLLKKPRITHDASRRRLVLVGNQFSLWVSHPCLSSRIPVNVESAARYRVTGNPRRGKPATRSVRPRWPGGATATWRQTGVLQGSKRTIFGKGETAHLITWFSRVRVRRCLRSVDERRFALRSA
jgi:hypothetical protein